jgi:PAS domain-containing protein
MTNYFWNDSDNLTARKLTYNELVQTVSELEQDLLAYKNAKEDAVEAKEQLALIFNAVPDYIATIDKHFKIQRVNKSLADKLKCSTEGLFACKIQAIKGGHHGRTNE